MPDLYFALGWLVIAYALGVVTVFGALLIARAVQRSLERRDQRRADAEWQRWMAGRSPRWMARAPIITWPDVTPRDPSTSVDRSRLHDAVNTFDTQDDMNGPA